MLDTIAATLAVGPKYTTLGARLLQALDTAGNATLVVTDDPAPFPERTIKVPYTPDGSHIWHAKRHALRAGLERAQTVYFVDADYQLYEDWVEPIPPLAPLPVGATSMWPGEPLSAIRFRNIGSLVEAQRLACPHLLDQLQRELGVPSWREILWWGDELYAIARDDTNAWRNFLDAWDHFAHYQPEGACTADMKRMFVAGDGVAMAFAAAAAGWTPIARFDAFVPIRRAFYHVGVGAHYKLALEAAIPSPGA
jgi:hypothetical protein